MQIIEQVMISCPEASGNPFRSMLKAMPFQAFEPGLCKLAAREQEQAEESPDVMQSSASAADVPATRASNVIHNQFSAWTSCKLKSIQNNDQL